MSCFAKQSCMYHANGEMTCKMNVESFIVNQVQSTRVKILGLLLDINAILKTTYSAAFKFKNISTILALINTQLKFLRATVLTMAKKVDTVIQALNAFNIDLTRNQKLLLIQANVTSIQKGLASLTNIVNVNLK